MHHRESSAMLDVAPALSLSPCVNLHLVCVSVYAISTMFKSQARQANHPPEHHLPTARILVSSPRLCAINLQSISTGPLRPPTRPPFTPHGVPG